MAKKKTAKKVMGLSEGVAALSADCGRVDDVNDPLAGVAASLEPGEERGVPTLEPPSAEEIAAVEEPAPEIQTDDPPEELIPSDVVSIEVPLRGDHDRGLGQVNSGLTRRQNNTLYRIVEGLNYANARIANGKPVGEDRAKAIQWMLDKVVGDV